MNSVVERAQCSHFLSLLWSKTVSKENITGRITVYNHMITKAEKRWYYIECIDDYYNSNIFFTMESPRPATRSTSPGRGAVRVRLCCQER